jgi:hypothetical protein
MARDVSHAILAKRGLRGLTEVTTLLGQHRYHQIFILHL